jgi:hypothetical protein
MPPTARFNWPTLAASVGATPSATFVIRRSLPCEPTDTVLSCVATEPAPRATEFAPVADADAPSATELLPAASEFEPIATVGSAIACAL